MNVELGVLDTRGSAVAVEELSEDVNVFRGVTVMSSCAILGEGIHPVTKVSHKNTRIEYFCCIFLLRDEAFNTILSRSQIQRL